MEYLLAGGATDQFNVGTGTGHTVMEMIRAVEEVTGRKVPYVGRPAPRRRPAEPGGRLRQTAEKLAWSPQYTDLRTIVEHAWNFAKTRPPAER